MVPVIDLFAGPGGLGEGFSSVLDNQGNHVFQTIMSIERDEQAHKTLRLRSYVRKLIDFDGGLPDVYIRYLESPNASRFIDLISYRPSLWDAAGHEAVCAELKDGDNTWVEEGRSRLATRGPLDSTPWVLIGGPPCQAYSLVGRSRRAHDETLENDVKQTLYKCYLAFITELKPTVFIMENVKGLLSAKRKGEGVFDRICDDMRNAGYELRSLVKHDAHDPRDYVVKAEHYGIPQSRHRVILMGVRRNCTTPSGILSPASEKTVRDALAGIPQLRSGLSRRSGSSGVLDWSGFISEAIDELLETPEGSQLESVMASIKEAPHPSNTSCNKVTNLRCCYYEWFRGRLGTNPVLANHEARTHQASDLVRYLFCSSYALKNGHSARISEFPPGLYPNHRNVRNIQDGETIKFDDRFRTQVWDRPSTTITSHISKDGHYYIHPDPNQCRSLTVREAARLQTFPDDYLFEGNRTSQYVQVGNAVPPLLAKQIAQIVADYLSDLSKSE